MRTLGFVSLLSGMALGSCAPPAARDDPRAVVMVDLGAAAPADLATSQVDMADPYLESPSAPPPDAGNPPPHWACGSDAAAPETGATCDLPPSQCLDVRWLIYYANGTCVDGVCRWEKRYLDCASQAGRCDNGGCVSNGTA